MKRRAESQVEDCADYDMLEPVVMDKLSEGAPRVFPSKPLHSQTRCVHVLVHGCDCVDNSNHDLFFHCVIAGVHGN